MSVFWIIAGVILAFFLIYTYMAEVTVTLVYIGVVALVVYLVFNPHLVGKFWRRHMLPQNNGQDEYGDPMDLSTRNLQDLLVELKRNMSQPAPLTLRGQEDHNEEIRLNITKVRLLVDQINALKHAGVDIANFNAEMVLHDNTFEHFVDKKLNAMDRDKVYTDMDHRNKVSRSNLENIQLENEIKYQRKRLKAEKKRLKQDLKNEKADIKKKKAEIYLIKTEADVEKMNAQADCNLKEARKIREIDETGFIKDILNKVDPRLLPEELQAYLVACVFNKKNSSYDDYIMNAKLKDFMEKKADAETAKIQADARYKNMEADGINNKNIYEKWKQKGAQDRWN